MNVISAEKGLLIASSLMVGALGLMGENQIGGDMFVKIVEYNKT